jgi:hypothetical protein
MYANNLKQGISLPQKKASLILLAGVIAGSIFGSVVWFLLFTNSQGFALVSIGRFDNTSPRPDQPSQANWIEEPQVVVERMKSQNFARSVAERTLLPDIATLLPAKQYGGSGALNVRSLRDPNLLEIKVNIKNPDTARAAIEAVVEELVSEHVKKVEPLLREVTLKLQSFNDLAADARKSHDRLTKLFESLPLDNPNAQQFLTLLALKSVADSNLAAVEKTALDVATVLSSQSTRNTRIIQAPAVSTPKMSSLYQTMALSAAAGLILAFLYLQTRHQAYHLDERGKDDADSQQVRP